MEESSPPQIKKSLILSHKSPPSSCFVSFNVLLLDLRTLFCLESSGNCTSSPEEVKAMEWYVGDKGNELVVPSQEGWKQWGLNEMDSFDLLNKSSVLRNSAADADFSYKLIADELEIDSLVGEGDQVEISGVRGGISESSNCWTTTLLNNQDYQLDGFPWTNQADENFMNSLLVDDLHTSNQIHLSGSPSSQGTYSMTNNLTSGMFLGSCDMGIYEQMDSEGFYSFDWENKQSDASHQNLPNMIHGAVPMYNTPLGNATLQDPASRRLDHRPSVEDTVLQEFDSTVQKMTDKTRLCFRDALYRLASNSEKHLSVQGEHEGYEASEMPFTITTALPQQTLRSMKRDASESWTNIIDRTIADLMFNKLHRYGNTSVQQPSHEIGIPQSTRNAMEI